jgi:hypothetical protein
MSGSTAMRHHAALLGLVALLSLTGCGGSDTSGGASAPSVADQGDNAGGDTSVDAGGDAGSTSYPTQSKKACDVLTDAVAKKVLGKAAPPTGPLPSNSNDSITVTTCSRTNDVDSISKAESATILFRVAKDETGAHSNELVFESLPAGAEQVRGYGEKAFWNPTVGQLNILSNGNWYILSVGPINPRKHTLEETRSLADAIKDQL